MKAIIQGKRYDTETAVLIGESEAKCGRSDFSFWEAGLYKTKRSGAFFLAGSGGPMTRFGKSYDGGNSKSGGSKIIPLSANEAYEWAERELEIDALEEHFSERIADA